jgi:hypothetical protein
VKPGRSFAIFLVNQAVLCLLYLDLRDVKCGTKGNFMNENFYINYKLFLKSMRQRVGQQVES